ncbi:MAG: hypothetical protein CVV63_02650, partial [Tenericutes bacterium HGW-Tenericutes-8]
MKKIILLLLLVISSFGVHTIINANTEATTLVVHYFRYDDTYTNFNIWLWPHEPVSGGGVQHDFDPLQKDEHGVFTEIDLTTTYSGSTVLGIIIKQGGWDGYREVGGDRFIDLSTAEVIDGKIHAYFVEKDVRIGTSQADLAANVPDYRPKVLSAAFDASNKIQVTLTHIPEGGYELYENDTMVASGTATTKTFSVSLPSVDISKVYTLNVA